MRLQLPRVDDVPPRLISTKAFAFVKHHLAQLIQRICPWDVAVVAGAAVAGASADAEVCGGFQGGLV